MITAAKREKILKMLHGHCAYCGKIMSKNPLSANKFTIDHIVAKGNGGRGNLGNLLPACSSCNAEKGMLSIEEYRVIWQSRIAAFLSRMGFKVDNLPPVRFYFERRKNVNCALELVKDGEITDESPEVIKIFDSWVETFANEIQEDKDILAKAELTAGEILHTGLNPRNFSRPPKGESLILSFDSALNNSMIKMSNRVQNLECANERIRKVLSHCLNEMDEIAHRCAVIDKRT